MLALEMFVKGATNEFQRSKEGNPSQARVRLHEDFYRINSTFKNPAASRAV